MKRFCLKALLLCYLFCSPLHAQFYAPDTEYHDPVQRVFVVEAARVLGWLSGLHGSNFTEIKYSVTTKPDGAVLWDVNWLDAGGKIVKSRTVSYSTEDLKKGPAFYRSVFKQLWLAGWDGLSPLKLDEVRNGFWEGAASIRPSREQSLAGALAIVPEEKGRDWTWQPKLAGLLAHAPLPGTADRLTLDWLLLARSAAWLALSEQACSAELDDLWSPVLFQAGRERAACEVWAKGHSVKLENATPQEAGWNIWLRKPTSRDIYLFATNPTNLPMSMPMLAYDVIINQDGQLLADLTPDLAGSLRTLAAFHNYAPLYATRTTITGGHFFNGYWPVLWRADWLSLLNKYKLSSTDYSDFTNTLADVAKALEKDPKTNADQDASLSGFREASPLLRLAFKEGVGPLTPIAVVTSRDLLNYGWEMTGLQMGARYHFVAHRWGVPEQGNEIFKMVTDEVEGLMPFFKSSRYAKIYNYAESLRRLQMVPGFFRRVGFNDNPFDTQASPAENTRLLIKRLWLRPADFEWQIRMMWDAEVIGDFGDLVNAWRDQGGTFAAIEILKYLDALNADAMKNIPRGRDLEYELAQALPQPTPLYVRSVYDHDLRGLSNLEKGREVERMYWKNPDSGLEERVFRNYLVARAFKSAKRFYKQARPNLTDPVAFSNDMGQLAYVAGYLLKDREMQDMALEDSASASYSDMMMHVWDAASKNDLGEVKKQANEIVDRYEGNKPPDSRGRKLLNYLPLLPALRDPKHVDHDKAIRYFGKEESWLILRWIWIEKFNLPTDDAIALLGGRETGLLQYVLVCYLNKDVPAMLDALNKFSASRSTINEYNVLLMILYKRLHDPDSEIEDIDLKPAGSASIRELVEAKLHH